MRHAELGRLITRMVKSSNALNDFTMAGTMEKLGEQLGVTSNTIYKWRRGRHKPEPSVLAELGRNTRTYRQSSKNGIQFSQRMRSNKTL